MSTTSRSRAPRRTLVALALATLVAYAYEPHIDETRASADAVVAANGRADRAPPAPSGRTRALTTCHQ